MISVYPMSPIEATLMILTFVFSAHWEWLIQEQEVGVANISLVKNTQHNC